MTSKNILIILLSIIIVASVGCSIFLFSTKYTPFKSNTEIPIEETVQIPEEKISQKEIDELPGCIAAITPVDENFSNSKNISNETKKALDEYRKNWQDICSGKKERTLAPLWVEAKKLTDLKKSKDNFSSALCDSINDECGDIVEFAPGIGGLYAEGMLLGFRQSQKIFAENIKLGTQEDKEFFATFVLLNIDNANNFLPWVEQTWDYGGCTKYGDYDWVGTLKIFDELSKKISSPKYLEEINLARNDITNYDPNNVYQTKICTCGDKKMVTSDLEKILQYANGNALYKEKASGIVNFIQEIKSGKISVLSETERHCSGG